VSSYGRGWVLLAEYPSFRTEGPTNIAYVRWRSRTELPRGQARVALGLLCLPEDPVAYSDIAAAFGISLGTVYQTVMGTQYWELDNGKIIRNP
jgi:hypothetical protein